MEITKDNINSILSSYEINPSKNLGQNFLVNPTIAERIVSLLDIQEDDNLLEVGPGLGSLTHFLASYDNHLALVDIDVNMTAYLCLSYKQHNVDIVRSDICEYDVSSFTKIVSNLPYSSTSDILLYLLKNAKSAKKFVLMSETEAFNRFSALSGKDYGPINILLSLIGSLHQEFSVDASNFYPIPKVSSTVFSFNLDKEINRDKAVGVYNMCRQLFINRRKTIYNNLKKYLKDESWAKVILSELDIPLSARAEEISPETYLKLYERIQTL